MVVRSQSQTSPLRIIHSGLDQSIRRGIRPIREIWVCNFFEVLVTMSITYGSVCSGIEAASVAWEPLGWEAAWLSEIEPFPNAVLAHHWPNVPNLGDMTKIHDDQTFKTKNIDLLVG